MRKPLLHFCKFFFKNQKKIVAFFIVLLLFLSSTVLSQPIQANNIRGCIPMLVRFSNSISYTDVTEWRWDLGDGNVSLQPNPVYVYTTPGTFTIKLTIKRANGSTETFSRPSYILVGAIPEADFTFSAKEICNPDLVSFTDKSITNGTPIQNYFWDFGDGNTGFGFNIVKSYNLIDTFSLFLRVTNIAGCTSTKVYNNALITKQKPNAFFEVPIVNQCAPPATITFNNKSNGVGTLNYLWDMGDGNAYIANNVVHTYKINGNFRPILRVNSSNGCFQTYQSFETLRIGGFKSNFTTLDSICTNTGFNFSNISTPILPISTQWHVNNVFVATGNNYFTSFSTIGTRTIKMINTYSTCVDSIIKTVKVIENVPFPSFTATKTRSVCVPFTTTFTPSFVVPIGANLEWNFGDGNTSTDISPTHTYQTTGNYTVSLKITGANGCTLTNSLSSFIRIENPRFNTWFFPVNICLPNTAALNTFATSIVPVAYYVWEFGDGKSRITTQSSVSHQYENEGTYNVTITYVFTDSCRETIQATHPVNVANKPTANFSFTPTQGCTSQQFLFTNSSTGYATINWNVFSNRDFKSSSLENPNFKFTDTGTYSINLTVTNTIGCRDTKIINKAFRVAPPYVKYTYTGICGPANKNTRFFTNRSIIKEGMGYLWDFGDGNTSTQTNPTHTFPGNGVYIVKLTVVGDECTETYTENITIAENINLPNPIVPRFTFNGICGMNNLKVRRFFNSTTNIRPGMTFLWDFGDGNTSTQIDPVHSFATAGTYNVKLTVVGDPCNSSVSQLITIKDTNTFSVTATEICKFSSVGFKQQDTSSFLINISWSFGDGTFLPSVDAQTEIFHTYRRPGVYTVRAFMPSFAANGCTDTLTRTNIVTVKGPPVPALKITNSLKVGCVDLEVELKGNDSGRIDKYRVDWGDGNEKLYTTNVFKHIYKGAGLYTVKLSLETDGCTDSTIYPNLINVSSIKANFLANAVTSCPQASILLTSQVSFGTTPIQYNWSFGNTATSIETNPTIKYANTGNYTVQLIATDANGCKDTIIRNDYIKIVTPKASFTVNDSLVICVPAGIQYTFTGSNNQSQLWSFGDGGSSSLVNPLKTITQAGKFITRLVVTSPGGCTDSAFKAIEVIKPNPTYQLENKEGCLALPTNFKHNSLGGDTYVWIFGDGYTDHTGQLTNKHLFERPGAFKPYLFVVDNVNCLAEVTVQDSIKVYGAIPNFNFIQAERCDSSTVTLTASATQFYSSIKNYHWNFGNSTTAVTTNNTATVKYQNPGIYSIQLITETPENCTDTVSKNNIVIIDQSPTIQAFTPDTVCAGNSITPIATIQNAKSNATYSWRWSNNEIATTASIPTIQTTSIGLQTLQLIVTNPPFACTDTFYKKILVSPLPVANYTNTLVCINKFVTFTDSSTSVFNDINKYEWKLNGTVVSTNNSFTYPFVKAGTYTLVLQVTTAGGCTSSTQKTFNIINISPKIFGDTITVRNNPVPLQVLTNGNIQSYSWQPSIELSDPSAQNPIASITQSRTYTVLVTTTNGCQATDSIHIKMYEGSYEIYVPTAFAPAGVNKVFKPIPIGVVLKSFRVFNRLGNIIYESNNSNFQQGWNGNVGGVQQPAGTYVWTVEAVNPAGEIIVRKGTVVLLR